MAAMTKFNEIRRTIVGTIALVGVLAGLATGAVKFLSGDDDAPKPGPSSTSTTPGDSSGESVAYRTCADVKKAGKAPLHKGDPGYSRSLDRDGDGIACTS